MSDGGHPARVLLACCGLEHTHRGFESFARECFETLRDEPLLEMRLIKGSGAAGEGERSVSALRRDGRVARALGRLWRGGLEVEQLAFALSLQPEIARWRPDVVYLSEWFTGVGLARMRLLRRQSYALVLSNGSMAAEGFEPFDRVHQHTAPALEYVLARGADPAKHILLPVAFRIPPELDPPSPLEREALRRRLGLPVDRRIVISTSALNRWHKRLDYVIEEIARLPEPRPYLLMVGATEPETEGLRALAHRLLSDTGHSVRSVPRSEVDQLLRASDVFVLASLAEGLPRALVEAMSHGLACVAHDYPVAAWALGGHGFLADLTQRGALAGMLQHVTSGGEAAAARHRSVYRRFSWDVLKPRYVDMLHGAMGRRDFSGRPRQTSRLGDRLRRRARRGSGRG